MSDTIAAVSTGTQVCAIGIVRMSGSKAIDIADRLFSPVSGRKMADCEDRKLIYYPRLPPRRKDPCGR